MIFFDCFGVFVGDKCLAHEILNSFVNGFFGDSVKVIRTQFRFLEGLALSDYFVSHLHEG